MRTHIGQYEIVDELGRGGMGVVYKAHDPGLDRFVAIKCLAESLAGDETLFNRFLREAKSVAQLSHPNIIQVYVADQSDGQPYFVMEFVQGETLAERLAREGQLPTEETIRIIKDAASALQTAHDAGVIHRDVKPSNILLNHHGSVKVTDFGIAFVEGMTQKLTSTGNFVGTPGYLSPEVCRGEETDRRSDIFSLGVVMYEALAGQMAFTADSPFEMMKQVVEARYVDIHSLNSEVDDQTRAVLDRMLAANPRDRYQYCADLIADLDARKGVATSAITPGAHAKEATMVAPVTPPTDATPAAAPQTPKTVAGGPTTQRRRRRRHTGSVIAIGLAAIAAGATASYTWLSDSGNPDDPSNGEETEVEPAPNPPDPPDTQQSSNSHSSAATDISNPRDAESKVSATDMLRELRGDRRDRDGRTEDTRSPDIDQSGGQAGSSNSKSSKEDGSSSPTTGSGGSSSDESTSPEPPPTQVVVMAVGDPALANPVESRLEAALRRNGHTLMEESFIDGIEQHVEGEQVYMADLARLLTDEGADVLVLARIIPAGERLLQYYGRSKTAYTSQIDVKTYDLATRSAFDGGWQKQVTFTDINVTEVAHKNVNANVGQLTAALADHER